ncbi:unnamed protein product, partial [Rotaria sp. Silwood2]
MSDAFGVAQDNIERIAIDQRGSIGSFYDRYEDNIKGKLGEKVKTNFHKINQPMICMLTHGHAPECENLLKLVGINHQLRLSISLEMTRATGIASLINYSQPIDEHTRLFYIYQESNRELTKDHLRHLKNPVRSTNFVSFATHIVTEIIWGFHILVILQLPANQAKQIDVELKKLLESIIHKKYMVQINSQQRTLLDQIVTTTIYSNIDVLTKLKKLEYVYQTIRGLQNNYELHERLKYILTPIEWLYGYYTPNLSKFYLSETEEINILEYYLIQQASELKVLNIRVNHDLFELLQGIYKIQFKKIQDKLTQLQVLHMKDIERLHNVVLNIRKGVILESSIKKEVSLDSPKEIQQLNTNIIIDIEHLESKMKLIKKLKDAGFEYCDVEELGIQDGLTTAKINDVLFGTESNKVIFFSNDTLKNNDQVGWTEFYSQMLAEKEKNRQLHLVYADFTYSTYKLEKMAINSSEDMKAYQNSPNSQSSKSETKRKAPLPPSPSVQTPLPTNEFINILLLGESGVGKSTFINAFANYLNFQNLDDAEKGKPIVIIPVSFMMTINDNFDEKLIKFGEIDSNENHNNSGQSVTQQCKSYVFKISNGKKLRIIDTPGFGDTRGFDQDNLNMEEIFSFLHNINYINGICFLFKPEIVQLNSYLKSCCTQLFDYFGQNISDFFIFCFTNARSTFFAPGNTRPLLTTFFQSFLEKKIPFQRKNTFCFDSEAFRYLVAIKDSMNFDPNERNEFEQSWTRSVAESERFRDFLCTQHEYRKNHEWQSIKDVQFQINFMIRPMLETMRNLLRNIILFDQDLSIKLSATHASPSSMLCYKCHRNSEKFNQFWIIQDYLHNSLNS